MFIVHKNNIICTGLVRQWLVAEGSVSSWNVVEAVSEIWNVKYKIWNFIRIFLLTISVHLLYIYTYGFSVYLSSLTSLILSFSFCWWTFKLKNIIGVLNEQDFYEIHHEIWNIEMWNLHELQLKFEICWWNLKYRCDFSKWLTPCL